MIGLMAIFSNRGKMSDVREELKKEVCGIEDAAALGKVEAFVLGMKAEKEIAERADREELKPPSSPSSPEKKRKTHAD